MIGKERGARKRPLGKDREKFMTRGGSRRGPDEVAMARALFRVAGRLSPAKVTAPRAKLGCVPQGEAPASLNATPNVASEAFSWPGGPVAEIGTRWTNAGHNSINVTSRLREQGKELEENWAPQKGARLPRGRRGRRPGRRRGVPGRSCGGQGEPT